MSRIILLVEDSSDDTFLFERAFKRLITANSDLRTTSNGFEALNFLSTAAPLPALIVSDLKMPGMDGIELLRAVKSTRRLQSIPVVIFTSSDQIKDLSAARAAGADGYIVKPSDYRDLEAICRALNGFVEEGSHLPEFLKLD